MPKINYKSVVNYQAIIDIAEGKIPESKNFSELAQVNEDGEKEFEAGDGSQASERMVSDLHADAILVDMLFRMNDREKIILMYQILRESGYNLNHGDCAKTLSLTREHYMYLLKEVKLKAAKVLQGVQE
jgi:hypothetical protein